MQNELIAEARRQVEICNACRYCEGLCSVFPAIGAKRNFLDGDITQLANLCHNCQSCYYACQYTAPHDFDLNLPRVLAEIRHESWKDYAFPQSFACAFDRGGVLFAACLIFAFAFLFAFIFAIKTSGGEGFYQYMSHGLMVAVFVPAFLFPFFTITISMRRYWKAVNGPKLKAAGLIRAFWHVLTMKNLAGGHGKGCNFEDEDRPSNRRRYFHQATFYGFLLCFASTSVATILHYAFNIHAPYPFWSIPKLLGVSGGVLLSLGTIGLGWLKTKADPELSAVKIWGAEMAFIVLLFAVSTTGLMLYAGTGTPLVAVLLPTHLATVLVLFLLTPYSKMIHGFYRMAALVRNNCD